MATQYRSKVPGLSDSESSDDEDSLGIFKRKRKNNFLKCAEMDYHNNDEVNVQCDDNLKPKRKKKNNIWGNVLIEESVVSLVEDIEVRADENYNIKRGVESYAVDSSVDFRGGSFSNEDDEHDIDYKSVSRSKVKERLGERNPPIKERIGEDIKPRDDIDDYFGQEHEYDEKKSDTNKTSAKDRLGRKHVKHRVGHNSYKKPCEEPLLEVKVDDSLEHLVHALNKNLREPKIKLLTQIVEVLGNQKVVDLHEKTMEVEKNGGMMTANASRRRTRGGVFIQLMKLDPDVTKEMIKTIFQFEEQEKKEFLKKKRKLYEMNNCNQNELMDTNEETSQSSSKKKRVRKRSKKNMERPHPPSPNSGDSNDSLNLELDKDNNVKDIICHDNDEPKLQEKLMEYQKNGSINLSLSSDQLLDKLGSFSQNNEGKVSSPSKQNNDFFDHQPEQNTSVMELEDGEIE